MSAIKTKDGFERSHDNPGAIINSDSMGLQAYKAQKRRFMETDVMKEEIQGIKRDMVNINQMLMQILNRLESK